MMVMSRCGTVVKVCLTAVCTITLSYSITQFMTNFLSYVQQVTLNFCSVWVDG
jgi:uncharacterized membrane protein YwzB